MVVLFAAGLVGLLMVAALAFDAGILLVERRTEQNAADAAALAGARYLPVSGGKASAAAVAVAEENGYVNGVDSRNVSVHIPPVSGAFKGQAGYVEVDISSTRPSIFAAIMGFASFPVGGRAVAANQEGLGGGYSILALDPNACQAMKVTGSGEVLAYGNIQVNSSCLSDALKREGNGTIEVTVPNGACNVVGGITDGGGQGELACVQNPGAPAMPDPLAAIPAPPIPPLPQAAKQEGGTTKTTPDGCPGSATPATETSPAVCQFQSSYKNTTWRLYPGLYPGGIKLQGGTFYLEPGIYYLGGGGLDITGNGTVTKSVAGGGTTGPAGGVLFYNGKLPGASAGPVSLNGQQANIQLYPLDTGSLWDGLVIFQDRSVTATVTVNGSSSAMQVRGTVYVPSGLVKVNGSGGELTMDQIIAATFLVNGNGGKINALNDEDFIFALRAAGLVE